MRFFRATRKRGFQGALPSEEPLLYPYGSSEWLLDLSPVVVFAPHPDDETFGCGGTLLRMSRKGAEITLVAVTDGRKGAHGSEIDTNTYVKTRRREFDRVADALGARSVWWGFGDRETSRFFEEIGRKAKSLVSQIKPALVFLPSPWEIHPDHRVVTEAVLSVLQGEALKVVFYEGIVALRPNLVVDISGVAQEKMELMKIYSSQIDVLPYHTAMEGLNRLRALTVSNSTSAEAFVVLSVAGAKDLLKMVRETEALLLPARP